MDDDKLLRLKRPNVHSLGERGSIPRRRPLGHTVTKQPKNIPTEAGQRVKLRGRPWTGETTVIWRRPHFDATSGREVNWVNVAWDWDCYVNTIKAQEDWDALPEEYKDDKAKYYGKMTKGNRPDIPPWGWCDTWELEIIQ